MKRYFKLTCIQQHTVQKFPFGVVCKMSQPDKVFGLDGHGRLNLDADNTTVASLNDQINFMPGCIPEMVEANVFVSPGGVLEQFTEARMADPALEALISKVDVVVDPDMDAIYPGRYAGTVQIHLRDGRVLRERVDESRGMPENPMTPDELSAKARSLVAASAGADKVEPLLDAVNGLFDAESVGGLNRLMSEFKV